MDLGSAEVVGAEILRSRMFSIWGDDPLDLDEKTEFNGPYGGPTCRKSRDLAALNKLRTWIDNPVHLWKIIFKGAKKNA